MATAEGTNDLLSPFFLMGLLPGKREERLNRWDAVTDGDWGSEGGQQWCASLSLTDIIYHTGAFLGADKVLG